MLVHFPENVKQENHFRSLYAEIASLHYLVMDKCQKISMCCMGLCVRVRQISLLFTATLLSLDGGQLLCGCQVDQLMSHGYGIEAEEPQSFVHGVVLYPFYSAKIVLTYDSLV